MVYSSNTCRSGFFLFVLVRYYCYERVDLVQRRVLFVCFSLLESRGATCFGDSSFLVNVVESRGVSERGHKRED